MGRRYRPTFPRLDSGMFAWYLADKGQRYRAPTDYTLLTDPRRGALPPPTPNPNFFSPLGLLFSPPLFFFSFSLPLDPRYTCHRPLARSSALRFPCWRYEKAFFRVSN